MRKNNYLVIGYKETGKDEICKALGFENEEAWGSKYHKLSTFFQSKNAKLSDYKVVYCVRNPWAFVYLDIEDPNSLTEDYFKEIAFKRSFYEDKMGNLVKAIVIDRDKIMADFLKNNLDTKEQISISEGYEEDMKIFYKSNSHLDRWINKYFSDYNETFGFKSPLNDTNKTVTKQINQNHVGQSLNEFLEETGDLEEVKELTKEKLKKHKSGY